ncbi:unnamed protein product [Dovyalis caffra]|uniref:Uncharacterized protein n=1 Tax=Dovyalis caffra TaxID=77055 RepID=A0AAV1REF3_9ROSI|nr:unnamed protein product [Dovyalis caffra]
MLSKPSLLESLCCIIALKSCSLALYPSDPKIGFCFDDGGGGDFEVHGDVDDGDGGEFVGGFNNGGGGELTDRVANGGEGEMEFDRGLLLDKGGEGGGALTSALSSVTLTKYHAAHDTDSFGTVN